MGSVILKMMKSNMSLGPVAVIMALCMCGTESSVSAVQLTAASGGAGALRGNGNAGREPAAGYIHVRMPGSGYRPCRLEDLLSSIEDVEQPTQFLMRNLSHAGRALVQAQAEYAAAEVMATGAHHGPKTADDALQNLNAKRKALDEAQSNVHHAFLNIFSRPDRLDRERDGTSVRMNAWMAARQEAVRELRRNDAEIRLIKDRDVAKALINLEESFWFSLNEALQADLDIARAAVCPRDSKGIYEHLSDELKSDPRIRSAFLESI